MAVLVIAEHDNATLKSSTLNTVTAAMQCGAEVHLLVVGHMCSTAAQAAAKVAGVAKILVADAPHLADGLAENLAEQILAVAQHYTHILAPATSSGKSVMPRVAARLDASQISEASRIVAPDTFERPIYAGNAIATVHCADPIKIISVRTTCFPPAKTQAGSVPMESIPATADSARSRFISRQVSKSARPELDAAKIVVSGGRGLGSSENYRQVLEPLADKLGAALGASRAAVDAGFVPNDYQVGQTGKVVAPDLYIAIAISGAIQHLAGMKDSKVIVAINKDAEAPIFEIADYGLVGDLFTVVPELTAALG